MGSNEEGWGETGRNEEGWGDRKGMGGMRRGGRDREQ